MSTFKDLFSVQAKDYARYRPTYPRELYTFLKSISQNHELVWDAGTGNGQAAIELARDFEKVFATDPSEKQISEATSATNVTYKVEKGETPSLAPESVDLITVAQAFHWFNHQEFAQACKLVGKKDAHLVVWSYALASITPEIDRAIDKLYVGLLDNYWEKERRLVEEGYRSVTMPFTEIPSPKIDMSAEWTLEQLLGYFKTWSALQNYLKKNPITEIERCFEHISEAWGDTPTRIVTWPLNMRVWKIH